MVSVPGGDFQMGDASTHVGSTEERPVHKVRVRSFRAGRYEVTFDEWQACVDAGACRADLIDEGWGRGRRPLVNVDWNDAQTYVRWLSARTGKKFRLLTEAEWEFAARAGAHTAYSWGDQMVEGNAVCYAGCGEEADKTAAVGTTPPNALGLHDFHGNVWEWTEDCWHDSYDGAPTDGSAWTAGECTQRTARGGAWLNVSSDVRSSIRAPQPTSIRFSNLGFRVASDD